MKRNADQIELTGISADGFHGVLAIEQTHGQRFCVDVVLELDLSPAARSDDLALTVDYDQVASSVTNRITGEPYRLIETLADRIAADCLEYTAVTAVQVTVHKPLAPVAAQVANVAVSVRRERARP